jgi:hypothetical protein
MYHQPPAQAKPFLRRIILLLLLFLLLLKRCVGIYSVGSWFCYLLSVVL